MKSKNNVIGLPLKGFSILSLVFLSATAIQAAPVTEFSDPANNWSLITDGDDIAGIAGGVIVGDQPFDAEYLFYKQTGTTVSIGLQSGFNLITGTQTDGLDASHTFHAGDLFLSFDNDNSVYEYAFDFGARSDGYWAYNNTTTDRELIAPHALGLYEVLTYGNQVYPGRSDALPYAMKTGDLLTGVTTSTSAGYDGSESYWRIYSFDLQQFLNETGLSFSSVDIHWTMSCANDAIDGTAPVPEPTTMILFGTGLIGLTVLNRRRKINK